MEEELRLTAEAGAEVDRYLATVADALRRSGTAERDVLSVLQDLRSQVLESLSATAPGGPTVEDVRAVIAGMAPPESYADGSQQSPNTEKTTFRRRFTWRQRILLLFLEAVFIAAGLFLAFSGIEVGILLIVIAVLIAGAMFYVEA